MHCVLIAKQTLFKVEDPLKFINVDSLQTLAN